MINAVLTSEAALNAVLTQGPMVVNDYVLTVYETEDEYTLKVQRGTEEQSISIPKSKEDPEGPQSGTGLPDVSGADDGKMLVVRGHTLSIFDGY